MVVEIDYLSRLPPPYRKAVKALNKKLRNASTLKAKNRELCKFAQKYTMLPEIWRYWQG